jgi:hypothetical protein
MALITKLDTAVTNGSTLPILLPAAGVPGYAGRWIANRITGVDGDLVSAWDNVAGAGRQLAAVGAARPTLKVVGSDKYVQFNGTDDVLTQAGTSAAWKTTVLLMRVDAAPSTSVQLFATAPSTGPWMQRVRQHRQPERRLRKHPDRTDTHLRAMAGGHHDPGRSRVDRRCRRRQGCRHPRVRSRLLSAHARQVRWRIRCNLRG